MHDCVRVMCSLFSAFTLAAIAYDSPLIDARHYLFTRPNNPQFIQGRIMGPYGDYRVVRSEDVCFVWEAFNEREECKDKYGTTNGVDGIDTIIPKKLDLTSPSGFVDLRDIEWKSYALVDNVHRYGIDAANAMRYRGRDIVEIPGVNRNSSLVLKAEMIKLFTQELAPMNGLVKICDDGFVRTNNWGTLLTSGDYKNVTYHGPGEVPEHIIRLHTVDVSDSRRGNFVGRHMFDFNAFQYNIREYWWPGGDGSITPINQGIAYTYGQSEDYKYDRADTSTPVYLDLNPVVIECGDIDRIKSVTVFVYCDVIAWKLSRSCTVRTWNTTGGSGSRPEGWVESYDYDIRTNVMVKVDCTREGLDNRYKLIIPKNKDIVDYVYQAIGVIKPTEIPTARPVSGTACYDETIPGSEQTASMYTMAYVNGSIGLGACTVAVEFEFGTIITYP